MGLCTWTCYKQPLRGEQNLCLQGCVGAQDFLCEIDTAPWSCVLVDELSLNHDWVLQPNLLSLACHILVHLRGGRGSGLRLEGFGVWGLSYFGFQEDSAMPANFGIASSKKERNRSQVLTKIEEIQLLGCIQSLLAVTVSE